MAIVNYSIVGLIQLELGYADAEDMAAECALEYYDKYAGLSLALMLKKNHDYDEAWRGMRISSYTDLILMKLYRTKQIEALAGQTLVSEGVDANYMDMMNYAVFGLIKLTFGERLGYKLRWVAVNVSRLLLAVTFVFSGLVKVVDPRGTQYKFDDYFQAFGWSEWIPGFLPLWLAVLLAVFEFSYRDISILWHTSTYDFLAFFVVHECDDTSDALSGFGQSRIRLRMFRRCRVVDELGDVRQECRAVGLIRARFSLPSVDGALCFRTQPVDDFPLFYLFCLCSGGFLYLLSSGFRFPSLSYRSKPAPSDGGSGRRGGAGVSYDIRT